MSKLATETLTEDREKMVKQLLHFLTQFAEECEFIAKMDIKENKK